MSGIVAVIPLRDGRHGKTRLAPEFDGSRRASLIAAMARHVTDVALSAPSIAQVVIVTRDTDFVERVMHGREVGILAQPDDAIGLNGALAVGRAWAMGACDVSGILILHADLPLLAVDDVEEMLDQPADLVIAADRHHVGTNAMVMCWNPTDERSVRQAESFNLHFGAGSFRAHLAEAHRAGYTPSIVLQPGTELDLDTLGDWNALPAHIRRALDPDAPEPYALVRREPALTP